MQDIIEKRKNQMRTSVLAALLALNVPVQSDASYVIRAPSAPSAPSNTDKISKAEAKRARKQLRQQFLNQKQNEAVSAV